MNNKENALIKVNEKSIKSIIYKIKRIFKNLFNKKNKTQIQENFKNMENDSNTNMQINTFEQSIKSISKKDTSEKNELYNLVRDFHQKKIREVDLDERQRDMLLNYYNNEIEKTKKAIENKIKVIENMV